MNDPALIKSVAVLNWYYLNEKFAPKIMLARRAGDSKHFPGYYCVPGGKVEKNECILLGGKREMEEETGVSVPQTELKLIECLVEGQFKCFFLEAHFFKYQFEKVRRTEPTKLSKWKLYTIDEALTRRKLMPSLREILLTKQQEFAKLKTY